MATKHKEYEFTTINHQTGEVVVDKVMKSYKVDSEPSFVKMYVDDVAKLNKLGKTASSLLFSMVKRVGYDSVIALSVHVKREIAIEMGIKSVQTVDNTIGELIHNEVLKRVCQGTYMLNPHYFAKGSWKDVKELRGGYIQMKITYNEEGRKVESTMGESHG